VPKIKIKPVWATVIALLVFVGLLYVFDESDEDEIVFRGETKRLEIMDSVLTGYREGMLSWKINADYIWAGMSKYLFRAEDIHSGRLYDSKGDMVLDGLVAGKLKVNSKSKTLSAFRHINATLIRRKKDGNKTKETNEEPILIYADELRFFDISKRSYLSGEIFMEKGDVTLFPTRGVEIDHDSNTAKLIGGFRMASNEFVASSNYILIDIDNESAVIKKGVTLIRKGDLTDKEGLDDREIRLRRLPAFITATGLRYVMKKDADMIEISGNIKIIHGDRLITGERASYRETEKTFLIAGNVTISLGSLDWLIDKKRKPSFNNEEMAESIGMKTTIKCDKLEFDGDKKWFRCFGGVVISQPDKTIKCRSLEYDDKKAQVILYGSVEVINEDQGSFKCQKLVLDIDEEAFDAQEIERTEFNI
jgi:lipopolysaccharide assembly outer membrane protein LptD (OstA)